MGVRATSLFSASLLAGLALALGAWAQDGCDSPKATQFDLNSCADASFKVADAQMNSLYATIRTRLRDDPDAMKRLVAAQRAWLAFRDAECEFASGAESGGSIYPMVYSSCQTALTTKRNGDLKKYLKCAEGDIECPVPAG
jgi:uncharacterized protein YecT (DUF1311 family)